MRLIKYFPCISLLCILPGTMNAAGPVTFRGRIIDAGSGLPTAAAVSVLK